MTELYFIRHGETVINQEKKVNGAHVDTPLTAAGVAGAKAAGRELQATKFDQVLVSPQKRAQTTAKLVLQENLAQQHNPLPLQVVPNLHEMSFGDWEGQPVTACFQDPAIQKLRAAPLTYDPSSFHGETFASVLKRGRNFLQQTVTAYPQQRLLVVGHGMMLTLMLKTAQGFSVPEIMQRLYLDNASISVLTSTDGQHFKTERWNDVHFLA